MAKHVRLLYKDVADSGDYKRAVLRELYKILHTPVRLLRVAYPERRTNWRLVRGKRVGVLKALEEHRFHEEEGYGGMSRCGESDFSAYQERKKWKEERERRRGRERRGGGERERERERRKKEGETEKGRIREERRDEERKRQRKTDRKKEGQLCMQSVKDGLCLPREYIDAEGKKEQGVFLGSKTELSSCFSQQSVPFLSLTAKDGRLDSEHLSEGGEPRQGQDGQNESFQGACHNTRADAPQICVGLHSGHGGRRRRSCRCAYCSNSVAVGEAPAKRADSSAVAPIVCVCACLCVCVCVRACV